MFQYSMSRNLSVLSSNCFETSSDLSWKSSINFGNLRKISEKLVQTGICARSDWLKKHVLS